MRIEELLMHVLANKRFLSILISLALLTGAFLLRAGAIRASENETVFLQGEVQGLGGELLLALDNKEELKVSGAGPFKFKTPLQLHQSYAVTIKKPALNHRCELKNGQGSIELENQVMVRIDCQKTGEWQNPQSTADRLSLPGFNSISPAAAMDDHGNAVIAWIQEDGKDQRVLKGEYREGKWSKPASFAAALSPAGGDAKNVKVAMAANGDIIIAWEQRVKGKSYIMLAEKRQGKWRIPKSLAEHISFGEAFAWEVNAAMDAAGNSVIVWDQETSSGQHAVYKSTYLNGVWQHPVSLADSISPQDSRGGDAIMPKVVMNNRGEALIVWEQDPGGINAIFKSEYRKGGWQNPHDIKDYINPTDKQAGKGGAYRAFPALSDSGQALIAWEQIHGRDRRIYLSEYTQGSWRHPKSLAEAISPPSLMAQINSLTMDSGGNAKLLWNYNQERHQYLMLSELSNGKWQHPAQNQFLVGPKSSWQFKIIGGLVNLADNGETVLTWMQMGDDSLLQLWLAEYRNGLWYLPGKNLGLSDLPVFDYVTVGSKNGDSMVVWQQNDGKVNQIYTSQFHVLKGTN